MDMINYFANLYKEKKQVALLTWAYSILAVASIFIAGLVALINQTVGVGMLIIPLVAIVALCMNVVAWSLVRFALDTLFARAKAKEKAEKTEKKSAAAKKSTKK